MTGTHPLDGGAVFYINRDAVTQGRADLYGVSPTLVMHDDTLPPTILTGSGSSRLRRGLRPSRQCPTGNPLKTPEGALFNIGNLGLADWLSCCLINGYAKFFGASGSSNKAGLMLAPLREQNS